MQRKIVQDRYGRRKSGKICMWRQHHKKTSRERALVTTHVNDNPDQHVSTAPAHWGQFHWTGASGRKAMMALRDSQRYFRTQMQHQKDPKRHNWNPCAVINLRRAQKKLEGLHTWHPWTFAPQQQMPGPWVHKHHGAGMPSGWLENLCPCVSLGRLPRHTHTHLLVWLSGSGVWAKPALFQFLFQIKSHSSLIKSFTDTVLKQ